MIRRTAPTRVTLKDYVRLTEEEMIRRAQELYGRLSTRRSVRDFSSDTVPRKVIESCLRSAGTAPSGANRQPWRFVVVTDAEVKRRIREAAEREERAFYERRATQAWKEALAPLGTGPSKPFLETAPVLIAVFALRYSLADVTESPEAEEAKRQRIRHYYVNESVGIATGTLITALHLSGLVCLTYTPTRMGFLTDLLHRPPGERPFLLLVTGYPAEGASVPKLKRKKLSEIAEFV